MYWNLYFLRISSFSLAGLPVLLRQGFEEQADLNGLFKIEISDKCLSGPARRSFIKLRSFTLKRRRE